jgi:hypothetical protein
MVLNRSAQVALDEIPSPLHVPDILLDATRQKNSPSNRAWLVDHCGIAFKICVAVPHLLFKRPPLFLKPDAKGKKVQQAEEEEGASDRWNRAKGNELWSNTVEKDRTHGWCLRKEVRANPMFSYFRGEQSFYELFSSPEVVGLQRDANGDILSYHVRYTVPECDVMTEASQVLPIDTWLSAADVKHTASIWRRHRLGVSLLTKCWSHVIFAEWISYLTVLFDCYLKPILAFPFPHGTSDTDKDTVAEETNDLPIRKFLGVEEKPDGSVNMPEYLQPSAETKFQEHLDNELRMVAADAEMPLRFLVGDPEGALSAASEDGLAVQDYLESTFKLYEPDIRLWCEEKGIIPKGWQGEIKPRIELRLSDEDKKKLELMEMQKIEYWAQIATVDEIRKMFGLTALPDGETGETVPNMSILKASQAMERTAGGNPKSDKTYGSKGNDSKGKGAG